ncbi:MAG: hypothetical protein IJ646_04150 [Clostridia bacterium]|nr:hypothetical protein [Clostridia bacterium]
MLNAFSAVTFTLTLVGIDLMADLMLSICDFTLEAADEKVDVMLLASEEKTDFTEAGSDLMELTTLVAIVLAALTTRLKAEDSAEAAALVDELIADISLDQVELVDVAADPVVSRLPLTPEDMASAAALMAVNAASALMDRSWNDASDSVTMLAKIAATSESAPSNAEIRACFSAAPAASALDSISEAALSSSEPQPNRPANQPPTEDAADLTLSQVEDAKLATSPMAL